jgi:hypothetical protein
MTQQKPLTVAMNSNETLNDIRRALLRIDAPTILLHFSAACKGTDYADVCNALKNSHSDYWDRNNWKKLFNRQDDSLFFDVSIYAKQEDIKTVGNGQRIAGNLKFVQGGDDIHNDRASFVGYEKSDDTLSIYIIDKSPFAARNDETILSFPELLGKYAIVNGTVGVRGNLSPTSMLIRMKNGESVGCNTFQTIQAPIQFGVTTECTLLRK